MTHVALHALVYLVVNGLLVTVWIVTGGDVGALSEPLRAAREEAFWPLWPMLGWGALLVLHVGGTVIVLARGSSGDESVADPGPRERWLTVAFVDVVGSTRLAERLGDEAWSDAIVRLRRTVRERTERYGGTEVGTQGDGVLLRFGSPEDAVGLSVAVQEAVAADEDLPLEVRIGVHAGSAVERDDDLLGRMVNVASRVADAAGAGEIVVTEPVADQADVELEDRGLVELEGVASSRHLFALRP